MTFKILIVDLRQRRRRRSAARGAGSPLPPARGGGSRRRGGGCRSGAHHLGPGLWFLGAVTGGARRRDAGRAGRPGASGPAPAAATVSPPPPPPPPPWAGPPRRCRAHHRLDPFLGWAPRSGRQVQRSASCGGGCVGRPLPASRPPPSPAGPLASDPLRRRRGAVGSRGGAHPAPHTRALRLQAPHPTPGQMMPAGRRGARWRPQG